MIFGHQTDDAQTTGSLDDLAAQGDELSDTTHGTTSSMAADTPKADPTPADLPQSAPTSSLASTTHEPTPPATPSESESKAPTVKSPDGDALLSLKQQALHQLTPLVHQLEQSPEERFRTTMMMIQSTDNADLIKDAYQAAQEIKDDKIRAQALLDVINEINYFTQQKN